jgi:hypothetical protein
MNASNLKVTPTVMLSSHHLAIISKLCSLGLATVRMSHPESPDKIPASFGEILDLSEKITDTRRIYGVLGEHTGILPEIVAAEEALRQKHVERFNADRSKCREAGGSA